MKAEDTVTFTKSEKFRELKAHSPDTAKLVAGLMDCQAEISFKAGQESGCYAEGWAHGIKEVVDFVKEHNVSANHNQPQYVFYYSDMEAKLKEWGINED